MAARCVPGPIRGQQRLGADGQGAPSRPQKMGGQRGKRGKGKKGFFPLSASLLGTRTRVGGRERRGRGAPESNKQIWKKPSKRPGNAVCLEHVQGTRQWFIGTQGIEMENWNERERERERAGEVEKCLGRLGTRMKERGSAGEEPIELTALLLNGNGDGANGEAERRSGYDGQRKLRLRSAKKMRGMKRDVNERKMGSKTSFGEKKGGRGRETQVTRD